MVWRALSPEGRIGSVAFLLAMVLLLLGESDVVAITGWKYALLIACLSFATIGLLVQEIRAGIRRFRGLPHSEDN